MDIVFINCPRCTLPSDYPAPVTMIAYPEDYLELFRLFDANLVLRKCPFCGLNFYFSDPIFIHEKGISPRLVISFNQLSPDAIETIKADFPGTMVANAPGEIVDCLLKLFENDKTALYDILNRFSQSRDIQVLGNLTPLQLRLFLAGANGLISMKIKANIAGVELPSVKEFYNTVICQFLAVLLIRNETEFLTFEKKVSEFVPVECLTEGVLEKLTAVCQPMTETTLETILGAWIAHYINAVVHNIKKIGNIHQIAFTSLICHIWTVKLANPEWKFNENLLLDSTTGQQLLAYRTLYDLVVGKFNETKESANLKNAFLIMDHYGWGERFTKNILDGQMIRVSSKNEGNTEFIDEFSDSLNESLEFFPDGSKADQNSSLVSVIIHLFLNSNYPDLAKYYLERTLAEAAKNSDTISCVKFCIAAIKDFNKFFHFQYAADLLAKIEQEYADAIPRLTKQQLFDFYIESGNTNRYRLELETALAGYEKAKGMLADGPIHSDPETEREAYQVSSRNLAVIYRDLGRFSESLEIFEQLMTDFPGDEGIITNLANLYLKVKQPEKALSYLQPGLSRNHPIFERDIPLRLAAIHANLMLGNDAGAVEGLVDLGPSWHALSNEMRLQVLNMALQLDAGLIESELKDLGVFDKAEELLFNKECLSPLKHSTFCFLVLKKLDQDNLQDARRIYERYFGENPLYSDYWEFNHFMLLYHYRLEDFTEAKTYFHLLISSLEKRIPSHENIGFVNSWLGDMERVQTDLMTIAIDLFHKEYLRIIDLLQVIEFNFGKDITTRLDTVNSEGLGMHAVIKRINKLHSRTECYVFFESASDLHLLHYNTSTGASALIENIADLAAIAQIRKLTLKAFKFAMPAQLKYMDAQLAPYLELMEILGAYLEPLSSQETRQVYIVAGKALANLPLHLILFSDQLSIIEKLQVNYINNLTTLSLLKKPAVQDGRQSLIVAAAKANDPPGYREQLNSNTLILEGRLGDLGYKTHVLSEAKATKQTVTQQLQSCNEAIFMCHGANGGAGLGPGICLFHKNIAPPALISLKAAKELGIFLLTWKDIEKMDSLPELVIMTACSSGVTTIGRGGVNYAFEQSLFSNGTTTLISPLWDTEQMSSLYWLTEFYRLRFEETNLSPGECFRLACLSVKKKYNNPYFWAPYILKGLN